MKDDIVIVGAARTAVGNRVFNSVKKIADSKWFEMCRLR